MTSNKKKFKIEMETTEARRINDLKYINAGRLLRDSGHGSKRAAIGNAPFQKLQMLPTNAKPVSTWSDRDEAFLDITMGIAKAITNLLQSQAFRDEWLNKEVVETQYQPKSPTPPAQLLLSRPIHTTDQNPILQSSRIRSFALPREGTNIEISMDKRAINQSYTRYALADGVGTSFLPGRWAEIITQQFVIRDDTFQNQSDFEDWLRTCRQEWHSWVNEANHDPWKELFAINSTENFRRFVQHYRDNGFMEVNDTTVMIIPLSGD